MTKERCIMQIQSKPRRNAESTKVLILDGLEAIIKRDGFTAVGIPKATLQVRLSAADPILG